MTDDPNKASISFDWPQLRQWVTLVTSTFATGAATYIVAHNFDPDRGTASILAASLVAGITAVSNVFHLYQDAPTK